MVPCPQIIQDVSRISLSSCELGLAGEVGITAHSKVGLQADAQACKDADRREAISLREEAEMELIVNRLDSVMAQNWQVCS